jgi:UDP-glucuronate 4-epimerase
MAILVTGAAGFIGMHAARRLLGQGQEVVGVDNLNDYYDPQLKQDRLALLAEFAPFTFHRLDLSDGAATQALFRQHRFEAVLHLAAQAGVRYSLTNPAAYVQSNLVGFSNVLEGCRQNQVRHLVYASSSSVYGGNTKLPFAESDPVDKPVSFYAATKKSNELMAHAYSHTCALATTGLRFFTVYGPWGRPDMAYFSFTRAILEGRPIQVFEQGRLRRDFTYIDDIVEGVMQVLALVPTSAGGSPPYRIFNIGNHAPVDLLQFIATIERALGKKAVIEFAPMPPGDVPATYADVQLLASCTNFAPSTPLEQGIEAFVNWYRGYYR